jgi:hypothetical protein
VRVAARALAGAVVRAALGLGGDWRRESGCGEDRESGAGEGRDRHEFVGLGSVMRRIFVGVFAEIGTGTHGLKPPCTAV